MKRQVRVMLKELNRLNKIYSKNARFLHSNKPRAAFNLFVKRTNLSIELKKWGYFK
ncbi:hypothetical protein Goe4_c00090 [Bacillus phage vB_BthP-Goe4]|uniref:Uncharacterized protein n=1 Tax=Bacillus phage vB_BthP-Goe4 TaxID=2315470 RepID=A0A386KQ34_9CAUD|nr:hypothetical protein H3015_gp35 [Bacillus phage vB_BthP-Goe4]AYD87718.1 hypothetical protein Goe4_c00090 [Bacillus phage vB_BthP-Goe4]